MVTVTEHVSCDQTATFKQCNLSDIMEIMESKDRWEWPCSFFTDNNLNDTQAKIINTIMSDCPTAWRLNPLNGCCASNYQTRCGKCLRNEGVYDEIYVGTFLPPMGGEPTAWNHYQNNIIDVQRHQLHSLPSVHASCSGGGGAPSSSSYFARPVYRNPSQSWNGVTLRETTYVRWCGQSGISKPGLSPTDGAIVNVRQWMSPCTSPSSIGCIYVGDAWVPTLVVGGTQLRRRGSELRARRFEFRHPLKPDTKPDGWLHRNLCGCSATTCTDNSC